MNKEGKLSLAAIVRTQTKILAMAIKKQLQNHDGVSFKQKLPTITLLCNLILASHLL